ncbi:uncharacterized protein M421DRAFT_192366 [Didymella exigua CBS 183.55]|uniref:Uncharacterized protein n=1 Tax=Didymella exigua CBS 183.55 TaxID=1150837 RepID=A0A6A5S0A6_9PLEO|nr:uncharacterized protein M421DRAFT_192366 [Didymella exigua CBS 183.55]KAF1933229.1 hypothetical protein M421DRAFT_192366 [Didymella exigua CBS 183.55]
MPLQYPHLPRLQTFIVQLTGPVLLLMSFFGSISANISGAAITLAVRSHPRLPYPHEHRTSHLAAAQASPPDRTQGQRRYQTACVDRLR